ncbi:DUF1178 family protein [Sphingomonas sp.]|uniref:DUF1178 family protein n=1 Tax=Sphingomonas sp. TaxID=28214 RepID=UPI0035BC6D5D
MIVFDLKCGGGHVFEAWFASGAAFDAQAAAGQVRCPVCDDAAVVKAAMAPNIAAKGSQRGGVVGGANAAMQAIAAAQAKMLEGSKWVGGAFPERARAMHAGEEAHATIHGSASLAEAKALIDDGVAVAPLPLRVVPPETLN